MSTARRPFVPTPSSPDLRRWAAVFALLMFATYPLVMADRLYLDDIWRSMHGQLGWTSNARPLADGVMIALNMGTRVVDLAPLPLWLGLAVIAVLLVVLRQVFATFSTGHAWWAMALLALQPFFLQNLSYRFDALPMALALSTSGLALAAGVLRPGLPGLALAALSLMASLCFYQAAVSVYFVLLAFHVLLSLATHGTPRWRLHLGLLIVGAATVLIYKGLSSLWLAGGYSLTHSQMVAPGSLPGHLLAQTLDFWRYAAHVLDGAPWWGLAIIAVVAGIGLCLGTARPPRDEHALALPWRCLLLVLIVALLPLGALGIMAALQDPIWRPRTFIGFGALAAGTLFCAVLACERHGLRWLGNGLLIVVLGGATVIAYAYGNAQNHQKHFENTISQRLIDDLRRLETSGPLILVGTLPLSPATANAMKAFPILDELMKSYLDGGDWWGYQNLYRLGLPERYAFHGGSELREAFIARCDTLAPLQRRGWYSIYRWREAVFVAFDGGCPEK
ncbi:glucosyltransferase domain-containing protein [Chromohalobacter israelensis]|uniref:glucosyltransferase domain-containing protein n=1 Tax=Chromohalobacter israelensis TaxID=141390 RepID=UPI00265C0A01|nr:glucosyltransferase domain-containing protein [Chromohalobacter salexigens]MDO0944761.1 glucosyltransferase domain-containing protein [Chromohalobacter salexigens]